MAKTKIVIIASNLHVTSEDSQMRQFPELDKLLDDGWGINQIIPVTAQHSSNSAFLGSVQVLIKLTK